jgi:hypothetical protein
MNREAPADTTSAIEKPNIECSAPSHNQGKFPLPSTLSLLTEGKRKREYETYCGAPVSAKILEQVLMYKWINIQRSLVLLLYCILPAQEPLRQVNI